MRVLLIGSGGREHALAWAIANSENCCEALYCTPGNAGIAEMAECVDIGAEDIDALVKFAKEKEIELVVVGPEAPLVKGLADSLKAAGITVFGPSQKAAQLEGSKGFMKDLCAKYDIPTAAYKRFSNPESAKKYIRDLGAPMVVKADGLAAGKGVIICQTVEEAEQAAEDMLNDGAFGDAGQKIVVEQFLEGEELSYFALSDGKTMLPLDSAQDHKRAHDGDKGPNTGGMGAYSPAHLMTAELEEKIIHRIIQPSIDAMAAEGCPFSGVLFAGIMVVRGEPYLLEYNVRFGDPECQALMMRLRGDVLETLLACAEGRLSSVRGHVTWSDKTALCVVMAAKGYPGSYKKGTVIKGLGAADQSEDVTVFHAGTAKDDSGDIINEGGRTLGVTALGKSIAEAQSRAYEAVDKINWPGGFCRRDIGWRALKSEEEAAA